MSYQKGEGYFPLFLFIAAEYLQNGPRMEFVDNPLINIDIA
jgi:hypothetical protein